MGAVGALGVGTKAGTGAVGVGTSAGTGAGTGAGIKSDIYFWTALRWFKVDSHCKARIA